MSNEQPKFVYEDIRQAPRREIFRLFGTPWTATRWAWLELVNFGILGIIVALIVGRLDSIGGVITGLVYGALLLLAYFVHDIGHVFAAKNTGHPMEETLVTGTRHVNLYSPYEMDLPSQVHFTRAFGGPLANIVVGLLTFMLVGAVVDSHFVDIFALGNLVIGIGALAPVDSVDGGVIWRELPKMLQRQ